MCGLRVGIGEVEGEGDVVEGKERREGGVCKILLAKGSGLLGREAVCML